jgi:hypothetical protein
VLAAGSFLLQGCYESLPLQMDVPPVATRLQVTLNDQGRAALSEQLGTAVDKVEGDFVAVRNDAYVVQVHKVMQFNRNSTIWNGERVSIAKQYAAGFQLRRLNAVKTSFAAVAVVAGVTAFFLGRSLLTGGGSESVPATPESNPSLRLGPVHR